MRKRPSIIPRGCAWCASHTTAQEVGGCDYQRHFLAMLIPLERSKLKCCAMSGPWLHTTEEGLPGRFPSVHWGGTFRVEHQTCSDDPRRAWSVAPVDFHWKSLSCILCRNLTGHVVTRLAAAERPAGPITAQHPLSQVVSCTGAHSPAGELHRGVGGMIWHDHMQGTFKDHMPAAEPGHLFSGSSRRTASDCKEIAKN